MGYMEIGTAVQCAEAASNVEWLDVQTLTPEQYGRGHPDYAFNGLQCKFWLTCMRLT